MKYVVIFENNIFLIKSNTLKGVELKICIIATAYFQFQKLFTNFLDTGIGIRYELGKQIRLLIGYGALTLSRLPESLLAKQSLLTGLSSLGAMSVTEGVEPKPTGVSLLKP